MEKLCSLLSTTDQRFFTPEVIRTIIEIPLPKKSFHQAFLIEPALQELLPESNFDQTSHEEQAPFCLDNFLYFQPEGLNEFPFYEFMLCAAKHNDPGLVRTLRSKGVPLSYASMHIGNGSSARFPAIFVAAREDSLDVIEAFNELGENIDEPCKTIADRGHITPIEFYAFKIKPQKVHFEALYF